MSSATSKRPILKGLTESRFVAFVPVLLTHVFYTSSAQLRESDLYLNLSNFLNVGLLGLDYFFVLSGFLITWLAYYEYNERQSFSLSRFYLRRMLRTWPLYFLLIAVAFLLKFVFPNEINELPPFWRFVTFTLNFHLIDEGMGFLFFLVFIWSIAVEEQFYFFWGWVLRYLKNAIPAIAIALIATSLVFRLMHHENDRLIYFHTLSVCGNFGYGALLAWVLNNSHSLMNRINRVPLSVLLLILAVLVVFYQVLFHSSVMVIMERSVFSLLFALIIARIVSTSQSLWIEKKIFHKAGTISYGLYLYHGLVLTLISVLDSKWSFTQHLVFVFLFQPALVLATTWAMASISYRYFEKPFLDLKYR
jgi:peptidoglycan/LPS O-acetylase OafA/YrhL